MPRYGCKKGCKPKHGAKALWHDTLTQCDFEPSYDPNLAGACRCRNLPISVKSPEEGKPTAPAPVASEAPAPAPKPSGGRSRLEASDRPAEVVNTKKIIQPPQESEFIVDGPHTIRAVNFGFGVAYFIQCRADDWFEWKAHMPRSQFKLSQNGLDTINMDAKNFYSKAVTRACIWVGCRTQQQAHAAIDTVCFFGEFGGFIAVVFEHNMKVYKESPKLVRSREKKKVEQEAKRMRERAIIDTTARPVGATA